MSRRPTRGGRRSSTRSSHLCSTERGDWPPVESHWRDRGAVEVVAPGLLGDRALRSTGRRGGRCERYGLGSSQRRVNDRSARLLSDPRCRSALLRFSLRFALRSLPVSALFERPSTGSQGPCITCQQPAGADASAVVAARRHSTHGKGERCCSSSASALPVLVTPRLPIVGFATSHMRGRTDPGRGPIAMAQRSRPSRFGRRLCCGRWSPVECWGRSCSRRAGR